MGKLSSSDLDDLEFNNYRAVSDGEEYEFHAVSVRQAWYLAYEYFNGEVLDYLAEIDRQGVEVNIILDQEV